MTIPRWEQGRATIEQMLRAGQLEQVPPSREQADRLIAQSQDNLQSACDVAARNAPAAYTLLYDAARWALTAVLHNQGLRPTRLGGHVAAGDAVLAQLDPPQGAVLRPFARMRRLRHDVEYPSATSVWATADDVAEDLPKAAAIVDVCEAVLEHMPIY
jgi:hypothetical protein